MQFLNVLEMLLLSLSMCGEIYGIIVERSNVKVTKSRINVYVYCKCIKVLKRQSSFYQ